MLRHLSVRRSPATTATAGGRLVRSLAGTAVALLAFGIGSWTVQSDGFRGGAEPGGAQRAAGCPEAPALDVERLDAGDGVTVTTDSGPVRYVVTSVRSYGRAALAEEAGRLFSQQAPGRLVLATCEDRDGERHLSNVVVVARPAPSAE